MTSLTTEAFTNSIDLRLTPVPGEPTKGIQTFHLAEAPVTNAQYERFDPSHRSRRGEYGFSKSKDGSVLFVSWNEASAFCRWLSEHEGKPYRLPSEAEWEHAFRAGCITKGPAEEEWCLDDRGEFKVTRANGGGRFAALAEDKNGLIGFRVALGPTPPPSPRPASETPLWAKNVSQQDFDWPAASQKPFFAGPIVFVRPPSQPEKVPFYGHNHCPSITWCANGDLLAVWFSTVKERDREMTILASRLRAGAAEWDYPSGFFKVPGRNMTGSSLFNDQNGTLFHLNGVGVSEGWAELIMVCRTSRDNGAGWKTRIVAPEHGPQNQVISGLFRMRQGILVQPCDSIAGSDGGTVLWSSADQGETWQNSAAGLKEPDYDRGSARGMAAGIHAACAQLSDGRILAFGRWGKRIGYRVRGAYRMPMSVTDDLGKTWTYSASEFPPINGGQRAVLIRLLEGPLFFASFTDSTRLAKEGGKPQGMDFASGRGFGLFGAVSYDDGKTWPVRRLLAPEEPLVIEGGQWLGTVRLGPGQAEPKGYLAAMQTPDGVIHLVSSLLHYRFNLKWLLS